MDRKSLVVCALIALAAIVGLAACGQDSGARSAKPSTGSAAETAATQSAQTPIVRPSHANAAPAVAPTSCRTVRGPLRVSGVDVLAANGTPYTPYGVTVAGLQQPTYSTLLARDRKAIDATAHQWCSNTVRLQLRQASLIGVSTQRANAFLAAIASEVGQAERDHLVVVLNDQTETDPQRIVGGESGPTSDTLAFWRRITARYGRDPQVIFDLFNEPRVQVASQCSDADWPVWQHGGTVSGHRYLGMQQLVDDVRGDGARNVFWVEGPCLAASLSKLRSYPIHGAGLVFAVHHPAGSSPHNATQWEADFGYLVEHKIAPVVDGEWTNRASGFGTNCWSDAPTSVPAYLSYLGAHHVGLVVYELARGFMITSDNAYDSPTKINARGPNRWRCKAPNLDEGAGAYVRNFFVGHNSSTAKPAGS